MAYPSAGGNLSGAACRTNKSPLEPASYGHTGERQSRASHLLLQAQPQVLVPLQLAADEALLRPGHVLVPGRRRQLRRNPAVTEPQNAGREVVILRPLQP